MPAASLRSRYALPDGESYGDRPAPATMRRPALSAWPAADRAQLDCPHPPSAHHYSVGSALRYDESESHRDGDRFAPARMRRLSSRPMPAESRSAPYPCPPFPGGILRAPAPRASHLACSRVVSRLSGASGREPGMPPGTLPGRPHRAPAPPLRSGPACAIDLTCAFEQHRSNRPTQNVSKYWRIF